MNWEQVRLARPGRLPVILSAEGAECGLACIAMVARFHGHDVDLNGLRQRFAFSLSGGSLRTLIQIAEQLDLANRAVKAEPEQLSSVVVPAILHWDMNHFVVLKRATRQWIEIHDPAAGLRRLSLSQVSDHFTGVVLELAPTADFKSQSAHRRIGLNALWSRVRGLWTSLGHVLALSIALQVVVFAMPFQLQIVIDDAIPQADQGLLLVVATGFAFLFIFQALVEFLRGWSLQIIVQLASFQIIGNIVRHLLSLRADFFEKRHVGDILSRITSSRTIQEILLKGSVAAVIDGTMAVVAGLILFAYSPVMAGIVYLTLGLNVAASFMAFPFVRAKVEERLTASASEQTMLMETVRAIVPIRLMGRESERVGSWRNLYGKVINADLSAEQWSLGLHAFHTVMTGLQTVAVVYLGASYIIGGAGFSVGMLIAFLAFRQTFTDRCMNLVGQVDQFRLVGLHLERLADIITADPDAIDGSGARFDVAGRISAQGLSFRYGLNDRLVLSGVDLDISSGEFIAITGRSGGGKTTLLKLLLGLNVPTEGRVQLDNLEANPGVWRVWREYVAVVAQDDRLISGTLAENIAFFDPDLDMARVADAATQAQIHDEITRMPMQYLSMVGDMGSALSGGQKQRLLLARALYRRPRILILDEGTANLDVDTEEAIADIISAMTVTRIVVAHRPALLRRADRVLLVADGTVSAHEFRS